MKFMECTGEPKKGFSTKVGKGIVVLVVESLDKGILRGQRTTLKNLDCNKL